MDDRQQEYERLIAPIEQRMMRAVWRVCGDPNDAEDALQEALLTVWKRWERIVRHANPELLVLHICIHAAHDVLRRKLRRAKFVDGGAVPKEPADVSASADENVFQTEQRQQVLRAIGGLPPVQARAMLMHAMEDVPYADTATALGCRESTVRKNVSRARVTLRKLLSRVIPAIQKEETSHA